MNRISQLKESGNNGICDKLKQNLALLTSSSEELKNAMITRDVKKIWNILAMQEENVRELEQYGYLWKELFRNNDSLDPNLNEIKNEITENATTLKHLGEQNGSLSRSYLSAINRALHNSGIGGRTDKNGVYGRRGKMQYKNSSLMINKMG